MNTNELIFLPQVGDVCSEEGVSTGQNLSNEEAAMKKMSPCPCCRNATIPNKGDALAYICPICLWEIDLFIQAEDEESDQNHGLTLIQARNNYKIHGAVLPRLKQFSSQVENFKYI